MWTQPGEPNSGSTMLLIIILLNNVLNDLPIYCNVALDIRYSKNHQYYYL